MARLRGCLAPRTYCRRDTTTSISPLTPPSNSKSQQPSRERKGAKIGKIKNRFQNCFECTGVTRELKFKVSQTIQKHAAHRTGVSSTATPVSVSVSVSISHPEPKPNNRIAFPKATSQPQPFCRARRLPPRLLPIPRFGHVKLALHGIHQAGFVDRASQR